MSNKGHLQSGRQAGFTIVEVMVAAVVLGLTASAMAVILINASELRGAADHYRQARVIAIEEIEDINHHFYNYNQATLTPDNVNSQDLGNLQLDLTQTNPGIAVSRTLYVTNNNAALGPSPLTIAGTAGIPYRRVRIVMGWTENGTATSLSLVKLVTQVK